MIFFQWSFGPFDILSVAVREILAQVKPTCACVAVVSRARESSGREKEKKKNKSGRWVGRGERGRREEE